MKASTKERVQAKLQGIKGEVKEVVGKAVHSPKVALTGRLEKISGKVHESVAKIKKTTGH